MHIERNNAFRSSPSSRIPIVSANVCGFHGVRTPFVLDVAASTHQSRHFLTCDMACIVVTNLCGALLSSDASKIGPYIRGNSSSAPREDNSPNLTERSLDLAADSQLATSSMSPPHQESTHRCTFARGPVSGLPSECWIRSFPDLVIYHCQFLTFGRTRARSRRLACQLDFGSNSYYTERSIFRCSGTPLYQVVAPGGLAMNCSLARFCLSMSNSCLDHGGPDTS